jgi:hypothetical protein
MRELNPLELAVVEKFLAGEHPVLESLRQQLPAARVKSETETGVGFHSTFVLPAEAVPAPVTGRIEFGDVDATIPGLKHGAGFLLFIRNGLLHKLEGFSYDEPWPKHVDGFSLGYSDSDRKAVIDALARHKKPD